jgi:hypothetical protein
VGGVGFASPGCWNVALIENLMISTGGVPAVSVFVSMISIERLK